MQSETITYSHYGFDVQLSKIYTHRVYNKFRETCKTSTAFDIEDDKEQGDGYFLVRHRTVPTDFPWIQHSFKVMARYNKQQPEESKFSCECLAWENTGT
jgi:hypothetical protein